MAGVRLLQFSILGLSRSGPSESVLPSNEYRNAKHQRVRIEPQLLQRAIVDISITGLLMPDS